MLLLHNNTTLSYTEFVDSLIKPAGEILSAMTPGQANLIHMALGIAGEAGELVDAIKRNTIYNKPLDLDNVKEELGDLLFYMTGIMIQLEFTIEEVAAANVTKLQKRYASKQYSDKQAIARADKNEA